MRLLSLPQEVQQELANGTLPAGQARALLGLPHESLMISACREIIANGLSTRETEKLVRHLRSVRKRRRDPGQDPNLRSIIEDMQRSLGTRVKLIPKAKSGKGKIEIEYYSPMDLERLIAKLTGNSVPEASHA